jgi:hypothetical protein
MVTETLMGSLRWVLTSCTTSKKYLVTQQHGLRYPLLEVPLQPHKGVLILSGILVTQGLVTWMEA